MELLLIIRRIRALRLKRGQANKLMYLSSGDQGKFTKSVKSRKLSLLPLNIQVIHKF